MPVYVVISYDIHDVAMYKSYQPLVYPILMKHGVKVLAMDSKAKVVEGTSKMMNVIMEFPSAEAVDVFYKDPEYLAIIDLRLNSTSNRTILMLRQIELGITNVQPNGGG
jgi:uncharacterized protein (DUF1330 family)